MPRKSLKRKVLDQLDGLKEQLQVQHHLYQTPGLLSEEMPGDSSDSSLDSTNSLREDLLMSNQVAIDQLETLEEVGETKRYLFGRRPYRKGFSKTVFERDLQHDEEDDNSPPWLTDEEFLQKYRMHRENFLQLVGLVKDHPVFQSGIYKKQSPAEWQLLVFCFFIGRSDNGASAPQMRNTFGISRGTANNYKKRSCIAIRSLKEALVYWPDKSERAQISTRIFARYSWLNVIGIADGTLLPLTTCPRTIDSPDYKGRKGQYTISTLFINDDKKRVRYYLSGFPGCAHDNRVWRSSLPFNHPQEYFGKHYFLVGDSAYLNGDQMVSSYKKLSGQQLPRDQEQFNTLMGKLRITSEHTIGMLKGRFPILRGIPFVITHKKKSMRRVLQYIDCCVILHNFLVDHGEDEIPSDWEIPDDVSEIGASLGEFDYAGAFVAGTDSDARRSRCMEYFKSQLLIM